MDSLKDIIRNLLSLIGDDQKKLPHLIVLFVISSMMDLAGLGLIGPYTALAIGKWSVTQRYLNLLKSIGLPSDRELLMIVLGVVLILIFLIKTIFSIWISYKTTDFSRNQGVRLTLYLMKGYQEQPYSLYVQRNSNGLLHNVSGASTVFSNSLFTVLRSFGDILVSSVILCFLAWRNPGAFFTLGAFLFIALYLYDRYFKERLRGYGIALNEGRIMTNKAFREGLEGLKEVRILGKEHYFFQQVEEGAVKSSIYGAKSQVISGAPRYLLELGLIAFIVLMIISALIFDKDLKYVFPTLSVFGLASIRLLPVANLLTYSITQLRFNADALNRIRADVDLIEQTRATDIPSSRPVDEVFNLLEIKDLSFQHAGATRKTLDEVSFTLQKGECVGIIGPSGSGKTTLVDIMLGFYEPQEGELLFNGLPIREVLPAWRAQVGYLPQKVFLIDDTLRRNIAFGEADSEIDESRLQYAIREAQLEDFINELPEGVFTQIGEQGVRLSGGQRQRVAIARALYHRRNVLILDEATSALDQQTEKAVVDSIQQLKGSKTMLIIAHRLTTLKHCDRIIRLEEGKIVEMGTQDILD